MAQARYDKEGRRLPDSGHGCGCALCEELDAPRYERRTRERGVGSAWGSLQRRVMALLSGRRAELA